MSKVYNEMITYANEHNFEVRFNHTVEGTGYKLTAWIPALNSAFVDGPIFFLSTGNREELNAKMRIIKEKTGIKNLMVYIAD